MSEYVYALHDFTPEHEDEIAFKAGQRIEVVEKDDQYNDGWWQGRNLAGKIGLFPKSYTTPAPPQSVLSTSASASTEPIITPSDSPGGISDRPDAASRSDSEPDPRIGIAIGDPDGAEGEMMKATMTDVQKAIEQLGRNDRDGAQSFSFSSSRDGDTDRETDEAETDGEIGEGWHRSARDKLAEQARKAVVEAQMAAEAEALDVRTSAPPIDVEMSDESEAEEEDSAFPHMQNMRFTHDHPHIPEEEEEEEVRRSSVAMDPRRSNSNETSSSILPNDDLPSPSEESGGRTALANQTSFTSVSPPPRSTRSPISDGKRSPQLLPTPTTPNAMGIVAPIPKLPVTMPMIPVAGSPEPGARATPTPSVARDVLTAIPTSLPSPALTGGGTRQHSRQTSQQNSITSTSKSSVFRAQSPASVAPEAPKKPASEWTVDEVVEWLKLKGFGSEVYEKFIEQEITGDVLLELDINLLKVEIGIVAFGKRMRIANAIAELRRPPSIILPDQQPRHPQSITHSVSQSFTYAHSLSGSTQHSPNSPVFISMGSAMNGPPSGNGNVESPRVDLFPSSRVSKRVSSLSSTGVSLNGGGSVDGASVATGIERAGMVGMVGLGLAAVGSPLPLPSGSDSALATADAQEATVNAEEDRGAQSEGEGPQSIVKPQHRRLFGRSGGSSTSLTKEKAESTTDAKETPSTSVSVTASLRPLNRVAQDDSNLNVRRGKRGAEIGHRGTERHSLFGGSFPTPLGKSRKPAPRITSTLLEESSPSEKTSTLSLSRLYSARKLSGRPSTSDGSPTSPNKDREREKSLDQEKATPKIKPSDLKESENLRKQTKTPQGGARGPNSLKPGKSIIEQIGQPDHQGWMRKKGDHYNSWKMRYFIIKGPHLYILRSNSKTEMKIKGYVNIVGYKVVADENIDPGRYGFRIVHETDKTHFFSHEEQAVVREWMKAIMKATIGRDYSKPVVSSVNISTIPLTVAQAMNPAPRPPSPTARAATQKALRRENPNQLSTRDARVLMGLPSAEKGQALNGQENERIRLESFFSNQPISTEASENGHATTLKNAPPRPSREPRRASVSAGDLLDNSDASLIEWANSHLPRSLQMIDSTGPLFGGLAILRLAEDMMGKSATPLIPDSAFPSGSNDDKLDGLFRLFDFLLDNDVRMGSVSINDVRQGKRDKIMQLIKALKAWEDRRKEIVKSIGQGPVSNLTWR